jgi:tetratricopeptide (TPR) repeat protein/AraC-like DNA-binding protein
MLDTLRQVILPPFLRSLRLGILLVLCLVHDIPAVNSQEQDSLSLFPVLKSTDGHKKLIALEKIYLDYYKYSPLKAQPYILQAIKLARKQNDKEAEAGACFALSYYYSCKGMTDSAFYLCQAGLDISRSVHSTKCLARGYGRIGNIYRVRGEKAKAIEYLKKGIDLDSTNKENIAAYCMSLGLLYGDAGCAKEAVFYYLKALKIREAQNKLIEAGYLCCNLAGFYLDAPYKDEGFREYEKAIGFFRQAKFQKGEGYAYNLLGLAYFGRNDYPTALKYFRKSLAINSLDTVIIRSGFSYNLVNIGDTWLKLKRYDSAQIYFSRALGFSSRGQEYIPMACTYLSLGNLNTQQKSFAKAIAFLKKGLYYSMLANYRAQWEEAYNLLSECYAASGDHEQALFYLRKRNEIRDSIITVKAHQDVANMMIKYETEKKDAQITRLNVDSHEKKMQIRIAVFLILAILISTGVLAYLTWLYYRKKLMPQVKTLNFIQESIIREKEGDNRRLRVFDKVLPPELKPFTNSSQSGTGVNKDLVMQLENLMVREKIYLNENLTLAETARLLDTNTSYLSRMINDHYRVNYSTFLNRYRIEEAKKMILDNQFNNFSMEGIAKSSGFRSKSTFNQVFKSSTGLTPSEFALRNGKVRA